MKTRSLFATLLMTFATTADTARAAVVSSSDSLLPYTTDASPPGMVPACGGVWVRSFFVQSPTRRMGPPGSVQFSPMGFPRNAGRGHLNHNPAS